MSNNITFYADAESPKPTEKWINLNLDVKLEKLYGAIKNEIFHNKINFLEADNEGNIIISLYSDISADKRGCFLLDLEKCLKEKIDESLCVWLTQLGDKNSLRNLRGIEFKK